MRVISCIFIVGTCLLVGTASGCKKKNHVNPVQVVEVGGDTKPAPPPPPPPVKKLEKTDESPKQNAPEDRSFVYNMYMQGQRPVILTDMKSMGNIYNAMMPPPLTVEAFKAELKKSAPVIAKRIEERIYVINLSGRKLRPEEILVYERQSSAPAGFAIVRADSTVVEFMPLEELKKELGIK